MLKLASAIFQAPLQQYPLPLKKSLVISLITKRVGSIAPPLLTHFAQELSDTEFWDIFVLCCDSAIQPSPNHDALGFSLIESLAKIFSSKTKELLTSSHFRDYLKYVRATHCVNMAARPGKLVEAMFHFSGRTRRYLPTLSCHACCALKTSSQFQRLSVDW